MLDGGYSPKIHDSSYLDMHKARFKTDFKGARFAADNHFSKGQQIFSARDDDIKFYVNIRKKYQTKKRKRGEVDGAVDVLSPQLENYNRQHAAVRARVDTPYAWIKNHFKSFDVPWGEGNDQLDHCVHIAVAVYNLNH